MTYLLAGAVGFLVGLVAHDLGVQSLDEDEPLRPLTGSCPRCRHHRGWTTPRCPSCGRLISREPVFALVTAVTTCGFLLTLGESWQLVPYLGFLLLTAALVVTDLEAFRITDRLNIPGSLILLGLLAVSTAAGGDWADLLRGLAGAASYFAGTSMLFLLVRGRGFGAGDVKLSAQLGLFTGYLGWSVLGWAVFATAMIGGVVALFLVFGGGAGRKTELPYGPPMILGAWTAIVLVGVGAIQVAP